MCKPKKEPIPAKIRIQATPTLVVVPVPDPAKTGFITPIVHLASPTFLNRSRSDEVCAEEVLQNVVDEGDVEGGGGLPQRARPVDGRGRQGEGPQPGGDGLGGNSIGLKNRPNIGPKNHPRVKLKRMPA